MKIKSGEPRSISKTVAVALGIICVLVAAQISILNYYLMTLRSQSIKYDGQIRDLQNTLNGLNDSLSSLEEPMLVGVGFKTANDQLASVFQFSGYVINIGQDAALNCRLYVQLSVYVSQGLFSGVEKNISIGTLQRANSVFVNESIAYSGGSLFGWRVTPFWDGVVPPAPPLISS